MLGCEGLRSWQLRKWSQTYEALIVKEILFFNTEENV